MEVFESRIGNLSDCIRSVAECNFKGALDGRVSVEQQVAVELATAYFCAEICRNSSAAECAIARTLPADALIVASLDVYSR